MNKKDNPFTAYSVVSQIAFIVLTPLLLFIWGGTWLVSEFSLPSWLNIVFILLGIIVMVSSAAAYLSKVIRMYDNKKDKQKSEYDYLKNDSKDYDYYDEHAKKKRL